MNVFSSTVRDGIVNAIHRVFTNLDIIFEQYINQSALNLLAEILLHVLLFINIDSPQ